MLVLMMRDKTRIDPINTSFVVWKSDSMRQEKLQMVKKRIIQVVHRATQLVHSNTFLLYRGTQQTFALNASQYLDLADIFFFYEETNGTMLKML